MVTINRTKQVLDDKSEDFTRRFYTLIKEGYPIRKAFVEAKQESGLDEKNIEADAVRIWPEIDAEDDTKRGYTYIPVMLGTLKDLSNH